MFTALVFGLFGLIAGSFLNVLILRRGARALSGRSACMSCAAKLPWYDLVPVFSFAYLWGRCRACGTRISLQYPLVEATTAVLFGFVGASSLSFPAKALACIIVAFLIAIVAYDLRHMIIPDAWVWTFNALTLLALIFNFQFSIFNLLAGPIAALPLFFLWFISGGRWMGLGDAKLAVGIGWLLGFSGLIAVLFAFVLGAIVGVPLLFFSSPTWKKFSKGFIPPYSWHASGEGFTMKSEVPFGPFLVTSCIIVWFANMYGIPIPLLNMQW